MAIQDDAKNFLLSALSRAGGDLPSLQLEWLASKGYTRGSIDERWSYYLRDNGQPPTGVSWDLLGLTRNKGGGASPYTVTELAALIAAAGGSWWRTADLTSMWQGAGSSGDYLLTGSPTTEGQSVAYILDIAQFGGLSASDFIAAATELVTNGDMGSATGWSLGTGWGISGGIATHAGTTAGNLSQAILTQNDWYIIDWTQAGGFVAVYLGFSEDLTPVANLNTPAAYSVIARNEGGANFLFRSSADGATLDDVSAKKLPGRPARVTNIVNRPLLNAQGLLSFDGDNDLLVTNIVSDLGAACTKITADAEETVVTEGQTVGAGSYSLPTTGWTDHILLPVSLATAGVNRARLNATLVPS